MINTLVIIAIVLYLSMGLFYGIIFIQVTKRVERDVKFFEKFSNYPNQEGEMVLELMKNGMTLGKARADLRKRKKDVDDYKAGMKHNASGAVMVVGFLVSLFLYPFYIKTKK